MNLNRLCATLGAAAACALAGCSAAPLSFIEGDLQTHTDLTLYPVRVVSVDRQIRFNRPRQPIALAPGSHSLVLQAVGGRGARGSAQKTHVLNVQPCTRYYLAARRDNPMLYEWDLVVEREEPVGACDAGQELKKAGIAAG
jgi:hypothetical protein